MTKEWAAEHVEAYLGDPPRTSQVDKSCPRWVFALQNHQAGFGHRVTNWAMGLHAAIALNVTFAHTSFDGGSGSHGNYNGWDSWLSFTRGEWGLDDAARQPGVKRKQLPSLGGYYGPNEANTANWKREVEEEGCNVLWQVPNDQWFYDISSTTRALMALKFAEHAEPAKPGSIPSWREEEVNIAVHVRFGDQYPTKETTHARVISDTILPALRAAGVSARAAVHVFAEDKSADDLPALADLEEEVTAGEENVAVYFHPEVDPRTTFWHLTQSDFFVMSFSSFSWAAAQVALRPLSFAQPSSDLMKMCAESSVCCEHSGVCGFVAHNRAKEAALRLAAREEACGGL